MTGRGSGVLLWRRDHRRQVVATKGMPPCPLPSWYLYTTDATSLRLLTDDGAPRLTERQAGDVGAPLDRLHVSLLNPLS